MKLARLFRTPALALVIGIPILSVLVGGTMLYLAISTSDPAGNVVAPDQAPMSKTSWRGKQP